jgi:hypothetical protein
LKEVTISAMTLYCEPMSMNMSLWAWTCEHDGMFLTSSDDMDGICQEFFCHIGHNLCWFGKIFYHVYGWMNNKWTFWMKNIWKTLFVEEICIAQVYGQGFKGLGIHSKSTIPN